MHGIRLFGPSSSTALFALSLMALGAPPAAAATHTVISVQLQLRGAGGAPLAGPAELEVALYGLAEGGAPIWGPVAYPDTPIGPGGQVLLEIEPPLAAVAEHSDLWLEIAVEGQVLDSRVHLTASPVSFVAHHAATSAHADTLDGLDSADFAPAAHAHSSLDAPGGAVPGAVTVDLHGNVGIGTTTPLARLHLADPGALIIPVGTTEQRPDSPVRGMLRFNTSVGSLEVYDGGVWNVFATLEGEFVSATGGTVTTLGDYRVHTFTSSGTFTVIDPGNAAGSNTVEALVVGGGGGGGDGVANGGGGGGGAVLHLISRRVSATDYPVAVGAGGARNSNGGASFFLESAPGGGGGGNGGDGLAGANGGGASVHYTSLGYQPGPGIPVALAGPGTAYSGHPGSHPYIPRGAGGGGGGAGGPGVDATNDFAGNGGPGVLVNLDGNDHYWGGGGGGGMHCCTTTGAGGIGGGGAGSVDNTTAPALGGGSARNPGGNSNGHHGGAGGANTGGGGGGGGYDGGGVGGVGGSGIVIIRYRFR